MMSENDSPITIDALPVPRKRIFVSTDGMFVVQWEVNRVQDLLSGKYHPYQDDKFGTPIADWELNQLKSKGIVSQYDNDLVYLTSSRDMVMHPPSSRSFYLTTSLNKTMVRDVEESLRREGLDDRFSVRYQEQYLIIRGQNGVGFANFEDAERARKVLIEKLPEYCRDCAVAFVEVNHMT
jgi:hypothetical protein